MFDDPPPAWLWAILYAAALAVVPYFTCSVGDKPMEVKTIAQRVRELMAHLFSVDVSAVTDDVKPVASWAPTRWS